MAAVQEVYKGFAPQVLKEKGCLMYLPTVDYPTDIATQRQESNVITVIEKWDNMEAFHAHLNAPHVLQFREDVKGLVEKVSIKVLREMLG